MEYGLRWASLTFSTFCDGSAISICTISKHFSYCVRSQVLYIQFCIRFSYEENLSSVHCYQLEKYQVMHAFDHTSPFAFPELS